MDGAFVIFVIFNCWSVILQIFEFQKCPFQGGCPQRGERLTMRTGKSWTHCVYCHNAWAFYWLLLSLYLSGLRWLEVPSHTQLASFIKLLVDLSLKFNIWRKTSGVGVVGEYLGWWDHFRPMTDRWFLWRQVQVQFLCGLLLLERTHNSWNETDSCWMIWRAHPTGPRWPCPPVRQWLNQREKTWFCTSVFLQQVCINKY